MPDLLVLSLQFFILFDNVQRQFLDLLQQNRLVGAEIDAVLFHVVRRGKVGKMVVGPYVAGDAGKGRKTIILFEHIIRPIGVQFYDGLGKNGRAIHRQFVITRTGRIDTHISRIIDIDRSHRGFGSSIGPYSQKPAAGSHPKSRFEGSGRSLSLQYNVSMPIYSPSEPAVNAARGTPIANKYVFVVHRSIDIQLVSGSGCSNAYVSAIIIDQPCSGSPLGLGPCQLANNTSKKK